MRDIVTMSRCNYVSSDILYVSPMFQLSPHIVMTQAPGRILVHADISIFSRAANITSEEAREALMQFVSEHCCYGAGAAKNMNIRNVSPSNALHVSMRNYRSICAHPE